MTDEWKEPAIFKGIAYFPTYGSARTIQRKRVPAGRIVSYGRGWAIQYWKSGPYYPEHKWSRDDCEAWRRQIRLKQSAKA